MRDVQIRRTGEIWLRSQDAVPLDDLVDLSAFRERALFPDMTLGEVKRKLGQPDGYKTARGGLDGVAFYSIEEGELWVVRQETSSEGQTAVRWFLALKPAEEQFALAAELTDQVPEMLSGQRYVLLRAGQAGEDLVGIVVDDGRVELLRWLSD